MPISLFLHFSAISFQKQVTYRFEYFMGILNGFLYLFIFTSLWKSLYSQSSQESHSGFTLNEIILYAILAMVVRISFTMDDSVITRKVRDGSVAIDLMRPTSFFYMNLSESVGYSLFHLFARAIPIFLISWLLFKVSFALPPSNLLLFLPSALMGYLILFMLNYCIGLLAFWFVEVFPFQLLKYGLITVFSGGIVPLDFFPSFLQPFLKLLPFPSILYTPTVILMGHVSVSEAGEMIMHQVLWLAGLAFLCHWTWKAGQNKLMIQGG